MENRILADLFQDLKSQDKNRRWNALYALKRLKPEGSAKHVVHCLKDAFLPIRRLACEILGQYADPDTMYFLIPMLGDPVSGIRVAAVEALGKMEYPPLEKPLCRMLEDSDAGVRWFACHALIPIGGEKALTALMQSLCDSSDLVCQAAREAIAKIRERRTGNMRKIYPATATPERVIA